MGNTGRRPASPFPSTSVLEKSLPFEADGSGVVSVSQTNGGQGPKGAQPPRLSRLRSLGHSMGIFTALSFPLFLSCLIAFPTAPQTGSVLPRSAEEAGAPPLLCCDPSP